ncbi:MAG: DUF6261 family protein, partial [Bacteroidales bacterium]
EKYDPVALHLQKSFGRVSAHLPDLAKIKAQEKSNALSNQLQVLDAERDTLIVAIAAQVKAMGKLIMPAIAPQVAVLDRFFDQHGRDIATANYNAETERLSNLLADYNAKADVKAAAFALNLHLLFDQLLTVNTQFSALFLQRNEGEAATEKVDTLAVRAKTDKALTAFFNAFEFCSSEYDDLDYATPANELNNLIAYYKTQLKARASRRNSGKDVSTEAPIG